MITINLTATGTEESVLKDYLENNVSEILAEKINNGIKVEKDGKTLVCKKDLKTFLSYACDEAKKQAEKSAKAVCVKADTVFGWALRYFDDDSIEGVLYNEDGTEYKPVKPVVKKASSTTNTPSKPATSPAPAPKPKQQMDLLDLLAINSKTEPEKQTTEMAAPESEETATDEPDDVSGESDESDEDIEESDTDIKIDLLPDDPENETEIAAETADTGELQSDAADEHFQFNQTRETENAGIDGAMGKVEENFIDEANKILETLF